MICKVLSVPALLAWMILIVSIGYADRDEFDSPELDPSWIWDNPAEDSSYDLAEKPGWLKITCAPGDHDIWNVRSGGPAVVTEAPDNYTFETHYTTEILDNCSVGLVFYNEDALGNANSAGPWTALFTQVATRLDWQHGVGIDAIQTPVANSNDAYVKVEKTDDNWKFYYKEKEDDDWELIIEGNYDIGGKHYAGFMVKNWAPGPEISGYFDYVETSWPFLSPVEPAGRLATTWGQLKQR
jgi:hypothetical protein